MYVLPAFSPDWYGMLTFSFSRSLTVAPLSNDNYYDLGLRAAECVALSVTISRRRDAKLRGEVEPAAVAARRASFAMSPNLGGATISKGYSAGGVGGVPPGASPGGRRKSSTTSLGLAGGRRRSSTAGIGSPIVEGSTETSPVGQSQTHLRSPDFSNPNPLSIGQFGVAMETEMQRRGSDLSVAFEDEEGSESSSKKGKGREQAERKDSLIEGLDEVPVDDAEEAEDVDMVNKAPLEHNDGLGIVV